jgi:hypothetical protein
MLNVHTGSAHDLASAQYIVVLPAFYNAAPTRHNTFNGALREVKKLVRQGYAPTVIDRAGATYSHAYGALIKD